MQKHTTEAKRRHEYRTMALAQSALRPEDMESFGAGDTQLAQMMSDGQWYSKEELIHVTGVKKPRQMIARLRAKFNIEMRMPRSGTEYRLTGRAG